MTMQPCWSCKKYAGGCSWTEVLDDGTVRFEPIPGWDAVPTVKSGSCRGKSGAKYAVIESYDIRYCPEYEDDGTDNTPLKLQDWDELRRMTLYRAGMSDQEIALKMGKSREAIQSWRVRRGLKRNGGKWGG